MVCAYLPMTGGTRSQGTASFILPNDTENNRILIFEKKDDTFVMTQMSSNVGVRPHYVCYDEDSERFFALSSMTGELYVFFRPILPLRRLPSKKSSPFLN